MVAEAFGKILNDILFDEIVEIKTFSSLPIAVTCVPISKNKRLERGFNQCELVIDEMEKVSTDENIIFNKNCLKIFRETEDQIGKSKSERIKNLKGAFVADESLVRDRNIFIIDDVVTTGATLLEARRALIEAGANKVVMIAIAH
jgi:ComF family protein